MQPSTNSQNVPSETVAQDLASLFARLGFEAVVRDPQSVEVLAATPGAEVSLLASEPGTVRVVTARLGGDSVRVELLPERHSADDLTKRQRQIADCLKREMKNQDIGEALGISMHTVRRHVEQIFRRLGVNNRRAAVEVLKRASRKH